MELFLVEDSPMVRARLADMLGAVPGAHVVGETGHAAEAIREILALRPDVVLLGTLRKIAAGGVHIGEAAAAALLQSGKKPPHEILSDREFEVMRLLVEGLGPTEIGERLHLSVKTVSTHKTRILEKLRVGSTAELVRYALEHRLV